MASDKTGHAEPSAAARDVVVFDFDGTLVSRDSFFDFAVGHCVGRPPRLLLVIALLPLALLLALRSRKSAGSALLWGMTVGASTRSFALALSRYARHTLPSYSNDAIFVELARHIRAGSRVVIAKGTMAVLVRGLLGARSLGPLPIVGSRVRRSWGGLVAETHCVGRGKVRELRPKLGILEWSTVYTDSFADGPLLSRARDVTLVSPSRRTVRRTQQLLDGATTLRVLRPD
ncbi:MAG TPA: HAD family hydrolase [Polyangiaceae bacterium]|nr:HAD family hydrolase [Polyangiaceae bacterium]